MKRPPLRVLFATAELAPIARVGGLAEAAAGLVRCLRARRDLAIEVVVPDYGGVELVDEERRELRGRPWTGPMTVRTGLHLDAGRLSLVGGAGLPKPHPYVDRDGAGWADNDHRFSAFGAAIAELVDTTRPDVVHLNDWHTALVPGLIERLPPTVLTIHTLGYQGITGAWLLDRLSHRRASYEWFGSTNPLLGAIRTVDQILTVSPTYADEITTAAHGMGLESELTSRRDRLLGIRNGIDAHEWTPTSDPHLASRFSAEAPRGKSRCRAALAAELGWPAETRSPIVGMVGRLVDQKGVDLVADVCRFLPGLGARLVVLGAGQRDHVDRMRAVASAMPDRVAFIEGYDVALGHRIFAGADLYLMPSRFEPCGLAQMQAMTYGAMPVVTDVGGLHDTVVDADANADEGTGFVAATVDAASVIDALHRAVRAWRGPARRAEIVRRAMTADWSWAEPAERHLGIYRDVRDSRRP